MTELPPLITRISVTYVRLRTSGQHETHIIGLTSKLNIKHIHPRRLDKLLQTVTLCCEDVLAQRQSSGGEDGSGGSSGSHELDDGQRTVTMTESDSAAQE
jgi:hypothetical protein